MSKLSGTIDRVIFTNSDNGYTIAKIIIKTATGNKSIKEFLKIAEMVAKPVDVTTTVVFTSFGVSKNLAYEFEGEWTKSKFGEQFEATSAQLIVPSTAEGLIKYLSSDAFSGIGPVLAKNIVKKFGDKTLEVLNHSIDDLISVKGVSEKKLAKIKDAWNENKEMNSIMAFLRSHDLSQNIANAIFEEYKEDCVSKILEDPYSLVEKIKGLGFKTADKIYLDLGGEKDSDKRVLAAINFTILEAENDGHCYQYKKQIYDSVERLLAVRLGDRLDGLLNELVRKGDIKVLEIVGEERLYNRKTFEAEQYCVKSVKELLERKCDIDEDIIEKWKEDNKNDKLKLSEEQENHIIGVIKSCNICTFSGSAGTGKSFSTRKLCDFYELQNYQIIQITPTGKSSQVLSEKTGRPSSTIHRLLKFNPEINGFVYNEKNKLKREEGKDGILLILDESSMVNLEIFYSLFKALDTTDKNLKFVQIGDPQQLESIGTACIFKDLILSNKVPFFKLTKTFRQDNGDESEIIRSANLIAKGVYPEIQNPLINPQLWSGNIDCLFIETAERENGKFPYEYNKNISMRYDLDTMDMIKKIYSDTIPKYIGDDTEIQILSPRNTGPLGNFEINNQIQNLVNKKSNKKPELKIGQKTVRLGDRVMETKNNYELNVFNGMIGKVININSEEVEAIIDFEEIGQVKYEKKDLKTVDLAYSYSIHKSQGSSAKVVIIILTNSSYMMNTRSLAYTAITRGRTKVIFIGEKSALAHSVKNVSATKRQTSVQELLNID